MTPMPDELFRTTLRRETAARLTGATAAGPRVYRSRAVPLQPQHLPAIMVYTLGQSDRAVGIGEPSFDSTVDLVVEIAVQAGADGDLEDRLDALEHQVKALLLQDPDWLSLTGGVEAIETDTTIAEARGLRLIASRSTFRVKSGGETWPPLLPDQLAELRLGFDCIDPSDPNLARPGPDGRAEADVRILID